MFIGDDALRRMMIRHVYVEDGECQAGRHCLALDCPLNTSEKEHLLHMLDMGEDEAIDPDTAERLGTQSSLEAMLLFAKRMNEALPEELKQQKLAEE
jgi:hypothetical protein